MKVFIANDSAILCDRIMEMLSEIPGIQVIGQASTSQHAIDSIRKLKPDTVILDIRMKKESGIKILKEIKKEYPSIILIIFTSYPRSQYYKKCIDLGANYFFDKSTEFDKLKETLEDLIKEK